MTRMNFHTNPFGSSLKTGMPITKFDSPGSFEVLSIRPRIRRWVIKGSDAIIITGVLLFVYLIVCTSAL